VRWGLGCPESTKINKKLKRDLGDLVLPDLFILIFPGVEIILLVTSPSS
jgi:hypothetical protein